MPMEKPRKGKGKVERPSRLVTGRTVAAGRDARNPAPIKSKVLRQPPLRSRARPATEKTLAQAGGEPSPAGESVNARKPLASISPPIKPGAGRKGENHVGVARTAGSIPATGAKPKRGRPRIGDATQTKPWVEAKMSERTWYRRQAEAKA